MTRKKFFQTIPWAFMCALGVIVGMPPPKVKAMPKPNPKDPLRCWYYNVCLKKAGSAAVLYRYCPSCPPPYHNKT